MHTQAILSTRNSYSHLKLLLHALIRLPEPHGVCEILRSKYVGKMYEAHDIGSTSTVYCTV